MPDGKTNTRVALYMIAFKRGVDFFIFNFNCALSFISKPCCCLKVKAISLEGGLCE